MWSLRAVCRARIVCAKRWRNKWTKKWSTVEGRCGKGLRRTCQRKASTHILKGTRDKGKHLWKDGGTNRCMAGGRKGRTKAWKEEGSDPRSERKGAEKSNIDPKICWKRVPESTKIVQKSTQKGPKKKPRETKNHSNVFKMILDPPGGRFPGYRARAKCHLGCQNRAKFVEKVSWKIVDFWVSLESGKMISKPLENRVQDGPKSSPEGKTRWT